MRLSVFLNRWAACEVALCVEQEQTGRVWAYYAQVFIGFLEEASWSSQGLCLQTAVSTSRNNDFNLFHRRHSSHFYLHLFLTATYLTIFVTVV